LELDLKQSRWVILTYSLFDALLNPESCKPCHPCQTAAVLSYNIENIFLCVQNPSKDRSN
jgi:hypothetical protein